MEVNFPCLIASSYGIDLKHLQNSKQSQSQCFYIQHFNGFISLQAKIYETEYVFCYVLYS